MSTRPLSLQEIERNFSIFIERLIRRRALCNNRHNIIRCAAVFARRLKLAVKLSNILQVAIFQLELRWMVHDFHCFLSVGSAAEGDNKLEAFEVDQRSPLAL